MVILLHNKLFFQKRALKGFSQWPVVQVDYHQSRGTSGVNFMPIILFNTHKSFTQRIALRNKIQSQTFR